MCILFLLILYLLAYSLQESRRYELPLCLFTCSCRFYSKVWNFSTQETEQFELIPLLLAYFLCLTLFLIFYIKWSVLTWTSVTCISVQDWFLHLGFLPLGKGSCFLDFFLKLQSHRSSSRFLDDICNFILGFKMLRCCAWGLFPLWCLWSPCHFSKQLVASCSRWPPQAYTPRLSLSVGDRYVFFTILLLM